jgi:hypothetical protein
VAASSALGVQSLPISDPSLSLYLRSIDDSLRTIKRIMVWWVILSAIVGFIALISLMFRK